jgi:hypothetical protein
MIRILIELLIFALFSYSFRLFSELSDSPDEKGDIGCHREQKAHDLEFRLHEHIVDTVIGDRR